VVAFIVLSAASRPIIPHTFISSSFCTVARRRPVKAEETVTVAFTNSAKVIPLNKLAGDGFGDHNLLVDVAIDCTLLILDSNCLLAILSLLLKSSECGSQLALGVMCTQVHVSISLTDGFLPGQTDNTPRICRLIRRSCSGM
jgi:hypothetical protein